jgi:methionyl-tRNA synthetase
VFNPLFPREESAIARKFYITTAIDYANAQPHLGTGYEKIGADVIARYHRLAGDDVFFLMGNDEHSQNVATAAEARGLDPHDFCDEMEQKFRAAWGALDISFDDFVRTTQPRHRAAVEKLFRLYDEGDIYKGTYEGAYCVGCEAFKTDRDLVEGECPNHGEVSRITEENYFFRLSSYTERLKAHYEAHPEFVQPEAYRNEMLALIDSGLDDVSISRENQAWGIPFPTDPSVVHYVWFDALINYLSGIGFAEGDASFTRYWPADIHVIGKDITRFHCLIWPAMLISAGVELPKTVSVHGFISVDGKKLSKSLGTIIDPADEVAEWGPDPVRYFLMREMSWGRDGDYNHERLAERYQHDLGNDLGNLLNRVLNMAEKYCGGCVPAPAAPDPADPLREVTLKARAEFVRRMEGLDPQGAILAVWEIVTRGNVYVDEKQPWRLVKEEGGAGKVAEVLWHLLEALRHALVYLWPVMPGKMAEGYAQLGLGDIAGIRLDDVAEFGFPEGVRVAKGEPLFPRKE